MFDISHRFKELRTTYNLSANKLAKSLGVDPSTISKIENNNAKPSIDLVQKMCILFDITLNDFFNDDSNTIVLNDELKELITVAKNLSPEQLRSLNQFIKTIK